MVVTNKFWHSADLLLMLLPYLDVPSTWALATAQPLVLDVLQHKFVWKGLLKRWINRVIEGEDLDDEEYLEQVKPLANVPTSQVGGRIELSDSKTLAHTCQRTLTHTLP